MTQLCILIDLKCKNVACTHAATIYETIKGFM